LSNGGLGISVVEASGSVTGYFVRGILGKSDVEMKGGLNWLRIVSGGVLILAVLNHRIIISEL
jgi:uncharacterized membrane protein YecN with MAPEG domain